MSRSKKQRGPAFEVCEQRLVLSANGLIELVAHDQMLDAPQLQQHNETPELGQHHVELGQHEIELGQHLAGAHGATGVDDVHDLFGFQGAGQTVAVIDSGVAFDHYALGNGFGEGHRVVGGWDFAENDDNPYDDAPAGFHGTHVAGIIGSDDATRTGVAPGVDIVALRVFDDYGRGDFDWVQQSLQWVLDNQHAFENPITTVNMSLGAVGQNLQDTPQWAMLEAQLEELNNAGIFVSVSAGNSFQQFGEQGLSYPAVSEWVVPVASADSAGTAMSDFSQRDDRVLVAPGENIESAVPDELFSFDGVPNDWASASGTSMAAPYVAGSSVLLREAMEFMGHTDIDQDDLYNIFRDTASLIYDSATQSSYHFIDVEAAIDSVVVDVHGDTAATAADLGALTDGDAFNGLIGRLADVDYFTFTASDDGVMSLTADATHNMTALWQLAGGGGTVDGGTLSFDVTAGETYTVSLASSTGHGHYDVSVAVEVTQSTPAVIDAGEVDRTQVSDINVNGEAWLQATATRDGVFTAEANFNAAAGNVVIEVYNAQNELVGTNSTAAGYQRTDIAVAAGETLMLRVVGTNGDVDITLSNVVEVDGNSVTVHGTEGDDAFSFVAGDTHTIEVNGLSYQFAAAGVGNVHFSGGAGSDEVSITGTNAREQARVRQDSVTFSTGQTSLSATNFESVSIDAGGGWDVVWLSDTAEDDTLTLAQRDMQMTSESYSFSLDGFDTVLAHATQGNDAVVFHDSASNDTFYGTAHWAFMSGGGVFNRAIGFDSVTAHATAGGNDRAIITDGYGDDVLTASRDEVSLKGARVNTVVRGFESVTANSRLGNDRAVFLDSAGNDVFESRAASSVMRGSGYLNTANGFDQVDAIASAGGYDQAFIYDSPHDDALNATPDRVELIRGGGQADASATGFEYVHTVALYGGTDTAVFGDSAGNDTLIHSRGAATLYGSGYRNMASGFDAVQVDFTSGYDRAYVLGVTSDVTAVGSGSGVTMTGDAGSLRVEGLDRLVAQAARGESPTADMDAVDYLYDLIGEWDEAP